MSEGRVFNYSAGPAALPEPVLRQAQQDLWDIDGTGIGILEHSHRGAVMDRITHETEAACRSVGDIPDDYAIFWLQGGATSQCYMIPANFLPQTRTADYFQTGKWANDSIKEVPLYGNLHICASSEHAKYSYIPAPQETAYSDNPVYVHFTSNNTIMGTEFHAEPTPPQGAFLVCDASSDIFSRPIDITKYGMIYAGAQKNLGPAGVTLLIVRRDLIKDPVRPLPDMMRYSLHADWVGRFNTPPTFGVYLMGKVLQWIIDQGGLEAMRQRNAEKAKLVYGFLDSQDFYLPHARPDSRSFMNFTFKCPTPELDDLFVLEAAKRGLDGLKGHRSIGGMRASMYNASPIQAAQSLVDFMKAFAHEHAPAAAGTAAGSISAASR